MYIFIPFLYSAGPVRKAKEKSDELSWQIGMRFIFVRSQIVHRSVARNYFASRAQLLMIFSAILRNASYGKFLK